MGKVCLAEIAAILVLSFWLQVQGSIGKENIILTYNLV